MPNVGFRIYTHINRPPKELIQAFANFAAPNLANCMGRMFCVHPAIKTIESHKVAGFSFHRARSPR
jgi:hypothetical protein